LQVPTRHASQQTLPLTPDRAMARKKQAPATKGNRNGDGPPSAPAEEAQPATAVQLNVLGQYIKDLSFESPAAPKVLQTPPANPQLQVTVNVNATSQAEETYEVVLNIDVHARGDTGVIYNVELFYAGLFRLRGVPQNMLQPVLFIDCPAILFPFIRRVLADVTRDGGFPPLMLDPIDFGRLYQQNIARPAQSQVAN
jgi:preprotein translocase subunit SecB